MNTTRIVSELVDNLNNKWYYRTKKAITVNMKNEHVNGT